MERDLRLILAIQALRAFLYGFGSVLIGTVLAAEGLSSVGIGAILTAMLAGMALSSLAIGRRGDRIGRRRAYALLLLVMGGAGTVFALTRWVPALILAALTGTLSTDPNESGPITSIEQAMMGGAPIDIRARVFGRYNAVAYLAGAVGSLAAGGPAAFRKLYPALPIDQRWLLAFPIVAVICALLVRRISAAMEADRSTETRLIRSRKNVQQLAALFALDAYGGGFVVQTFLVYWFHRRFGATTEQMGIVFFGAGLLQAGSSIVAGRLASKIGLLNTMVFTHLPSNILLIAVPFSPVFGGAVALLLARFALSQMDVPARQAYVVTIVDPEERTAAAAYTNTARYVTRPGGPASAGALLRVSASAPFIAAGGLKIVYDLFLYRRFRATKLEEARG
ncbi:MAG TPA: MFS transporter [Actinomycetota bacterium]|nr:MFS transporter [Actinomycetota bacterium]